MGSRLENGEDVNELGMGAFVEKGIGSSCAALGLEGRVKQKVLPRGWGSGPGDAVGRRWAAVRLSVQWEGYEKHHYNPLNT